jgi:RNA polymerase sigma-70 factor (ECF subfamily)
MTAGTLSLRPPVPLVGMLSAWNTVVDDPRVRASAAPASSSGVGDDLDARLARLTRAAAAGDPGAFRELVGALTPTLWRLAVRLVDDDAAADDVVQQAIVKLWRALPTIADPQATRAFACATLRHVAADEARRAARRRTTSLPDVDDAGTALAEQLTSDTPDAATLLQSAQATALVRSALNALPDEHRLVILLCDVDGVSYDDAAVALGVKPGTVASRLSRARVRLAQKVRALAARPAPRASLWPWSR